MWKSDFLEPFSFFFLYSSNLVIIICYIYSILFNIHIQDILRNNLYISHQQQTHYYLQLIVYLVKFIYQQNNSISDKQIQLSDGIRSIDVDTADTRALISVSNLDVTLITPRSTPGVSDENVLLAILNTITDSSNTVVKRGTAGSRVEDTRGVVLEDIGVGLNSNGDGVLSNSSQQSLTVVLLDILVALNGSLGLALSILALTIPSSVGVVLLRAETTVGNDVLESVVHQTTVATVRLGIAIDELLLRKVVEGTGLDGNDTFDGSDGRESPAGTAGTLVLDGVDGSLLSPIDGLGEVLDVHGDDVVGSHVLLHHATAGSGGLELVVGHISEGGETEGVGVTLLVLLIDEVEVLREDGKSVSVLLLRVLLVELGDVGAELSLVVGVGVSQRKGGNSE